MSWVKQRKLPAVEAIRHEGLPCNSLPDLWHALHLSYNAAANRSVQLSILDDVPWLAPWPWVSFSMLEMSEALKACSFFSFFFFGSKIFNAVLDRSPRQTIYNK